MKRPDEFYRASLDLMPFLQKGERWKVTARFVVHAGGRNAIKVIRIRGPKFLVLYFTEDQICAYFIRCKK